MRGPPAVYCHPNLQREILEVSLNLLIDTFLLNISKFCLNTYYVYHSGQILLKVTICVISIFIKLYPLIATTLVFAHQGGTRSFFLYSIVRATTTRQQIRIFDMIIVNISI